MFIASMYLTAIPERTGTKPQINQDAVRLMKELYDIDMEERSQYNKASSKNPHNRMSYIHGLKWGCHHGKAATIIEGIEDPTVK